MNHPGQSRKPHLAAGPIAAVLALLLSLPTVSTAHDNDHDRGPEVLSHREVLAKTGKSIAYWGARWWQWAFKNPEILGDTTGEFAALGDVGGPVFFGEGSGGDAVRLNFEVPDGQYILLPVATYIWTFFDPCADVNCAREIVNRNFIDRVTYTSVRVDGKPVPNMMSHIVRVSETKPLVFKVDAGPIQPDGYGGILNAVQGGYWLMLEPLPPGKHHISMFATVPNLDPFTGEVLPGYIDLDAKLRFRVRRNSRH